MTPHAADQLAVWARRRHVGLVKLTPAAVHQTKNTIASIASTNKVLSRVLATDRIFGCGWIALTVLKTKRALINAIAPQKRGDTISRELLGRPNIVVGTSPSFNIKCVIHGAVPSPPTMNKDAKVKRKKPMVTTPPVVTDSSSVLFMKNSSGGVEIRLSVSGRQCEYKRSSASLSSARSS